MNSRGDTERQLREWAAINADRDRRIRAAYHAGVTKHRIHVLSGAARMTVENIVKGITVDATTYTARCNVNTGDITVLVPSEDSDMAVIDGRTVFTATTTEPWGEDEDSMARADEELADLGWLTVGPWGEMDLNMSRECTVIQAPSN